MEIKNRNGDNAIDLTITPNGDKKWGKEKLTEIAKFAKLTNSKRSPERIRRNAMLAVR